MKYEYDLWNKIIDEQLYEQLDNDLDKMKQIGEELQEYSDNDSDSDSNSNNELNGGYYYEKTIGINSYEQMTNNDFPTFTTICMIGRRGSGKITAICDLLNKYNEQFIQNTLIIAPTERMTPMYKYKYPNARVEAHYRSELIEEFFHYGP